MDILNTYRQIIRKVLTPYINITYANVNVKNHQVFDPATDRYLILSEGWERHVEIVNERVWIQLDNTEDGIAEELIAAGIPKQDIVLGFHEPEIRPYTGFAVA
jgi:XisI protein